MVVPVARSRVLSSGLSVKMRRYCAFAPEDVPNTATTRNRIVRNRLSMVSNLRRIDPGAKGPFLGASLPSVSGPSGTTGADEASLDAAGCNRRLPLRLQPFRTPEPPSVAELKYSNLTAKENPASSAATRGMVGFG